MVHDQLLETHRTWIGYVQPVGLLVAPAALKNRAVLPEANVAPLQIRLDELVDSDEDGQPIVKDFPSFARAFLGWRDADLAGAPCGPALPGELGATLIEYSERLTPTYAVPAATNTAAWQMLIRIEPNGQDLDKDIEDDGHRWAASPHARFERLLRETGVPVGLLSNGRAFRLVHAPKGETSGFATFDLSSMLEVSGRPMLSAFHMLLQTNRLFGASEQNLPSLLTESRQYQETVSTQLAEQVLVALHEVLRGLVVANIRARKTQIVDLARSDPDHLYSGLLTALMRLVFILYAEDRDLFPRDTVWEQHYSLAGLFKRLRDDAALYPDTMDDRYGAWAQLIVLWRMIHKGAQHGGLKLTARRGRLFDPDRFPFLEGRTAASNAPNIPPVADGVVWRMLNALMVLDGEKLSYRTLDVEQIGSVYQAVMGFTVELTQGTSVALRPPKRGGAAATINLDALLAIAPAKRAEWVREHTDRKLTSKQAAPLKDAKSIATLEAALSSLIDDRITPKPIGRDIPVLQPTEARRKTGSHYTPRLLTEPIVAEALRPVLERLGPDATPEQILELKVLDPALGSGAFLVEACRQLAERLVQAWEKHKKPPKLPPDEDALLHAKRLVAQRCLYGVDRNAMAADLAKLSLWLATLAKDHEFTFLDHAIRHGDALVGLFRDEIARLAWDEGDDEPFAAMLVRDRIAKAQAERQRIREAAENLGEHELRPLLERADQHLADVHLIGDAIIAAFFAAEKPKEREAERLKIVAAVGMGGTGWQSRLQPMAIALRKAAKPLYPFHWELQFPEVFLRDNIGFDVIVGNPPYAGKNTIIDGNPDRYLPWLQTIHDGAHGNADLVAHFFRRAYRLIRVGGAFGLIATNTIRQGDTRSSGLRWIRKNGGIIYAAKRRYKWAGEAAVTVSVIHVAKGNCSGPCRLDGRVVPRVTAYLFDQGGDDDPRRLAANANLCFQGSIVLGMGFTFDDSDSKGIASPLSVLHELISKDQRNQERIFPYIGGEEINSRPDHKSHRFVINFEDMTEEQAAKWPDLLDIVRARVKPERQKDKRPAYRSYWWRFAERRRALYLAVTNKPRVLVISQVTQHVCLTFLPSGMVYSHRLYVFALADYAHFSVLQSRVHELWARFQGSSLEDRFMYASSACFETFPLPPVNPALEEIGRRYFEYRAAIMVSANKGMTDTYNRFNDPGDNTEDIEKLRLLHAEMDRTVLEAYGWVDIAAEAVFEPEWTDENGGGPIRYRWPEETRDKVLARLLELNEERSKEEVRQGLTGRPSKQSAGDPDNFELEMEG